MVRKELLGFFEEFLSKDSIFKEKKALQAAYTPDSILHRDHEIKILANTLAPCLRLEKPSNIFVYGKTGTGKTLSIKYTTSQILTVAREREIPLKIIYINCKLNKVADTEYRLLARLVEEFGREIPTTGLPTDEVYKIFFSIIDLKLQLVIIILDEIDQLVKKTGDEIIYNMTRINSELKNAQVTLIGISNDLIFTENLDPRVKSSLSEEELIFPPYNALQLQQILRNRSTIAFKEGVIEEGVIEKCAAYAAREHGDARRALELFRVAGELAERASLQKVEIRHIDEAEEKIERDRIVDIIKTQPKQQQSTLYSILHLLLQQKERNTTIYTGDVYDLYKDICNKIGLRPLTQRRVSDIIAELDMLGILNAKVVSKGRFGRTREISLAVPQSLVPKIKTGLEQSLSLQ